MCKSQSENDTVISQQSFSLEIQARDSSQRLFWPLGPFDIIIQRESCAYPTPATKWSRKGSALAIFQVFLGTSIQINMKYICLDLVFVWFSLIIFVQESVSTRVAHSLEQYKFVDTEAEASNRLFQIFKAYICWYS